MKITNLLSQHSGKWYEIGVYSKLNDPQEKIDIIAKFISPKYALDFLENMKDKNIYTEIVIR